MTASVGKSREDSNVGRGRRARAAWLGVPLGTTPGPLFFLGCEFTPSADEADSRKKNLRDSRRLGRDKPGHDALEAFPNPARSIGFDASSSTSPSP